jgi:hypothetical protein
MAKVTLQFWDRAWRTEPVHPRRIRRSIGRRVALRLGLAIEGHANCGAVAVPYDLAGDEVALPSITMAHATRQLGSKAAAFRGKPPNSRTRRSSKAIYSYSRTRTGCFSGSLRRGEPKNENGWSGGLVSARLLVASWFRRSGNSAVSD